LIVTGYPGTECLTIAFLSRTRTTSILSLKGSCIDRKYLQILLENREDLQRKLTSEPSEVNVKAEGEFIFTSL
jgi:hypothetical protein